MANDGSALPDDSGTADGPPTDRCRHCGL